MLLSNGILAFDLETKPKAGFEGFEDAALDFNRNEVTVYAFHDGKAGQVVRAAEGLKIFQSIPTVTHSGKFDFKTALSKPGCPLKLEQYEDDTNLMLVALPHKIPEDWLADYEQKRQALNKALGNKVHRQAGKYSLKAAAPYFLGVDPFWEVADHDNDEYALKDAQYTYGLKVCLESQLKQSGHYDFYKYCLMPWSRLLLKAELEGVQIDRDMLQTAMKEHGLKAAEIELKLREIWASEIDTIQSAKINLIKADYQQKYMAALNKLAPSKKKDPIKAEEENTIKRANTMQRYSAMQEAAVAKVKDFNFVSPSQLKSLFQGMGLDITNFDGDESTGKEVLERLLREGVAGIPEFLQWRKSYKLSTAFFPSYEKFQVNSRIHCNYNLDVVRTGRLSSNNPNNQQVPKSNLNLYTAAPGKTLAYRDASAIEPRLMAYQTECYELCKIFIEGSDFHSFNVRTLLGIQEDDATIKKEYKWERDLVKEIGLSLLYGASWRRIQAASAKRGKRFTDRECKAMFNSFQQKYEDIWVYKKQLEERIRSGEVITNVLGRPLSFEEDRIHMQSLNTLIQAGASDIVLDSARMFSEICPWATVVMLIHDAVVTEQSQERGQEAFDKLGEILLSWDMPTKWGKIPLLSEGYLADRLKSA